MKNQAKTERNHDLTLKEAMPELGRIWGQLSPEDKETFRPEVV